MNKVPAMTLAEAADAMTPPIPRRELARRMRDVKPLGRVWGRRGRRPHTYPVAEIFQAHARWVQELAARRRALADHDTVCQNSARDESAQEQR